MNEKNIESNKAEIAEIVEPVEARAVVEGEVAGVEAAVAGVAGESAEDRRGRRRRRGRGLRAVRPVHGDQHSILDDQDTQQWRHRWIITCNADRPQLRKLRTRVEISIRFIAPPQCMAVPVRRMG